MPIQSTHNTRYDITNYFQLAIIKFEQAPNMLRLTALGQLLQNGLSEDHKIVYAYQGQSAYGI